MGSPMVTVRNVEPGCRYYARVNAANFWKMVVAKTTPKLAGTDSELKDGLVRLALGPEFTMAEIIENDVATNADGSTLNEHFSPVDFARLVVQDIISYKPNPLCTLEIADREHFFSRAVLEEAGIIPKAA